MPLKLCQTKGYGREMKISCLKPTWKSQNDISFLSALIMAVRSLVGY